MKTLALEVSLNGIGSGKNRIDLSESPLKRMVNVPYPDSLTDMASYEKQLRTFKNYGKNDFVDEMPTLEFIIQEGLKTYARRFGIKELTESYKKEHKDQFPSNGKKGKKSNVTIS